jgi:hypothetical protein
VVVLVVPVVQYRRYGNFWLMLLLELKLCLSAAWRLLVPQPFTSSVWLQAVARAMSAALGAAIHPVSLVACF